MKKNKEHKDEPRLEYSKMREIDKKIENGELVTEEERVELSEIKEKIEAYENELAIKAKELGKKLLIRFLIVGQILALTISFTMYKSIGWAFLHGFFGWLYVIYYSLFL